MSRLRIREPFSGLSHLLGAILSITALAALLAMSHGRILRITAFSIYGLSLILLYTASTLYHSLTLTEKQQKWFQRIDHIAIFLLIAGTYTPVCLIALPGALGFGLLGAIYGIAVTGICLILFWRRHPHWVRVVLYGIMGWLAVLAIPHLRLVLPASALWWLVAGGLVYTVGVVFYATGWPKFWPGKFGGHDLWHCFVLGGSVCHFVFMLAFVSRLV